MIVEVKIGVGCQTEDFFLESFEPGRRVLDGQSNHNSIFPVWLLRFRPELIV